MGGRVQRIALRDDAWIDLDEAWLPADEASALLTALLAEEPWEHRPILVFGKEILQPRLISWAGALPYHYSGQTLPTREPPPTLAALTARVSALVGVPFNHVLLNRYRDGRDHMARHCDNEPELGVCPVIAALSLGAPRKFLLEHKRDRRLKRALRLTHGGLLVMGGTMQHTWRHAVPKMGGVTEERINLTWRLLRGPPGWRDPSRRRPAPEADAAAVPPTS